MSDGFDQWAIVEIMGHRQLAGRVTEQVIAGQAFLRVDVPAAGEAPAFSKLLGPSSIYGITPMSEQATRLWAEQLRARPLNVWDFPERVRAAIVAHDVGGGDDDDQQQRLDEIMGTGKDGDDPGF